MKIKTSSMIEGGMSVEDTIEALSKYVGMGAKIDIGQGGYDDIYLTYLKEETGPEKSVRIRRERDLEVTRQAVEISNKLIESGFLGSGKHAELKTANEKISRICRGV